MSGICKLCDQHKKLCRSHILPKSFTKRMRAGAPQVITVVVEEQPQARKSNGEHIELMLCESCEHLLKTNYEDYGTRFFVNKKNITENNGHVFITDFEYQTYFLFIVSILWRASVSSLNIYKPTQGLAELSRLIKPCILANTLKTHPPHPIRIDEFIKIQVLKIIDHTNEVPQSTLDSIILAINFERGESVDEGIHYYFMVDGFLVTASLFPLSSQLLKCWHASGRLLDRRFLKIPKVSFYDIKQLHECIEAISSTPNPFTNN